MTPKTSIGRSLRQRRCRFAGTRDGLLGVSIFVLIGGQASAFTAYVSNEKSNTLSVIDTDKFTVVKTIKVGQRPRGIELTRDGKFILVAVGDDDTIQVIDVRTHEIVATLPSGPDPELFTQDHSGKILYVANENDNTVTIIDLERRIPLDEVQVGVEPEGMGLSPDGKILVATSETTNMAHFIDTETRRIVANVLVDARPRFAEFKRDGSEVWVSSEIGGTVSIIDPVKHEVKKKITFDISGLRKEAIQAVGISITRDGKTGFIALGPANRIAVINAATHEVEKYLLVGQRVWHMAFTPDEKYLLTTNGLSNDVSNIDLANLKNTKTIQVGELPWGIAISHQCHTLHDDRRAVRRRHRSCEPLLRQASGADRRDFLHQAIDFRRSARPQRSWKEHIVLADHASLRHPAGSHPDFRPRCRTCIERGLAHGRRGVPTTDARPRSLRGPEPDLPCSPAWHRQTRWLRARRGGARADRAVGPRE